MKKIKEVIARLQNAIARLLWKPSKIRYFLTAVIFVFGLIIMSYGLIVMMIQNKNFWGSPVAILGASIELLLIFSLEWYWDLPDHKITKAEEALKGCESILEFGPGFELIELAKKTGQTEELEVWMEKFWKYKAAADQLHTLIVQVVDLPRQVWEAEQKRNDLYRSLEK